MGARLLKEARGLLPAWIIALCFVLAPLTALRLLPLPHQYFLAAALGTLLHSGLALGPLVLSSIAFGREFDEGTFGLLLSQPVSRWRLWWEKTGMGRWRWQRSARPSCSQRVEACCPPESSWASSSPRTAVAYCAACS